MNPQAPSFTPAGGQRPSNDQFTLPFRGPIDHRPDENDPRSKVSCIFFETGYCRNGVTCPYLHSDKPAGESRVEVAPTKNTLDTFTAFTGNALVQFEAGAAITKVTLPSDFSTARIGQLPHDSTSESVIALLRSHGLDTASVRQVRVECHGDLSSAVVMAEDPEFADLAATKLKVLPGDNGSKPTAISITTPMVSDLGALRMYCKKVECSWHKPYRTAWLHFLDHKAVDRVYNKFKDGIFKVKGQTVTCSSPTLDILDGEECDVFSWSICLTDVPGSATKADLIISVRYHQDKLHRINLGSPLYEEDNDTCYAMIQSLFTSVGGLEWWELVTNTVGKQMKAVARFQNEKDAREAARSLNNSALPFSNTAKLTVRLVHTAEFKVSALIYDAVQSQIAAHVKNWKESRLHFSTRDNSDPDLWYRVLKVEGENEADVTAAIKAIGALMAGTIAKDGTSILWHPSLGGNGVLVERLKQLQQKTGVLVIRNKAKSQISLFGPAKKCDEVQAAIAKILKAEESDEFNIDLDEKSFLWACRGGFKEITHELGPDNVRFDIISTPKRIITTGTDREYQTALAIVDAHRDTQDQKPDSNNTQDCSVCWTKAENPIWTSCHHVYCLDCFENLCLSATRQDSAVRVQCAGGSGSCHAVPSLSELQEHLSSAAFEELLERSFASYVRRHPHLLRYCPTADCNTVYRGSGGGRGQMRTCPRCLVPVCTSCHAQHGRASCAEYQDVATGRYAAFERLKREVGIKDCPQCATPLEKTDGCDHVMCRCGAHICWVCLLNFRSSDSCYAHMKDVHGGIGIPGYDDDDDDDDDDD